jgi:EmrB/QacA subfamily drug resistance transporter
MIHWVDGRDSRFSTGKKFVSAVDRVIRRRSGGARYIVDILSGRSRASELAAFVGHRAEPIGSDGGILNSLGRRSSQIACYRNNNVLAQSNLTRSVSLAESKACHPWQDIGPCLCSRPRRNRGTSLNVHYEWSRPMSEGQEKVVDLEDDVIGSAKVSAPENEEPRGAGEIGRRLALYSLSVGVLIIVLDSSVVSVAFPSILADLHLSGQSVVWMVNAYTLTYGGFLLLGGRLSDLYGRRRLFLAGIGVFTLASLGCGLAHTQVALLVARAVQGLAGAVVTAVSLSLIAALFSEPLERAKAIGICGFVCTAGGSLGQLLGGFLTKVLNWHWIFLINVPIGVAVCFFCVVLIPRDAPSDRPRRLDFAGALTVTAALTLTVFGMANGNEAGWASKQTLCVSCAAAVLLLAFLTIETRAQAPLMPFRLFRMRNLATAIAMDVLWSMSAGAWFVISTLYMQRVLGYDPLQVGLAFIPVTAITSVFSAGLSAKMVARLGIREPAWTGLVLFAGGLALFAHAPTSGTFVVDIFPGMVLIGLGFGISSAPLLLAALNEVDNKESGLASGVINTCSVMGGTIGLSALLSLANARTANLQHAGTATLTAIGSGYRLAFLVGAAVTALAALVGALFLRREIPIKTP